MLLDLPGFYLRHLLSAGRLACHSPDVRACGWARCWTDGQVSGQRQPHLQLAFLRSLSFSSSCFLLLSSANLSYFILILLSIVRSHISCLSFLLFYPSSLFLCPRYLSSILSERSYHSFLFQVFLRLSFLIVSPLLPYFLFSLLSHFSPYFAVTSLFASGIIFPMGGRR